MNIVIVEDHRQWARIVSDHVSALGYDVSVFECKADALSKIWDIMPDILIADASLPDGSMLGELSRIRSAFPAMGIIVITGNLRAHEQCMTDGADYYLTKPVSLSVLGVTLNALERRLMTLYNAKPDSLVWVLDSAKRNFKSNQGFQLDLTAKEGVVLSLLIQSPKLPVRHARISKALGYPDSIYDQHRIDVLLYRLRKKLLRIPGGIFQIRNIYAEGFLLVSNSGAKCALLAS
jgi:DNA-binding response OmpR family regulator